MKKTNPHFAHALEALEFLDEKGGPETVQEYIWVLTAIQAELGKRIVVAVEMIDE